MSESLSPRDGEQLSAYLAGDLDDAEAAALEARLVTEPELAARLEATRAVVEGLARLDEVELPSGFGERLRARLDQERRAAVAQVPDTELPAPVSLADARTRRTEWLRQRWPALGAAAAGLVGVALLAAAVLGALGPDEIMVAEEPAADEPQFEALDAPEDAPAEAAEEADEPAPLADDERTVLTEPLLLDTDAALADPDAARAHLSDTPAVDLLDVPVDAAEDLAAAFAVVVRRAEPFAAGGEPGVCLDTISAAGDLPVVPAQVESVVYEGEDALAYVTATARPGSAVLDRIEVWILDPEGCTTRLFIDATPER